MANSTGNTATSHEPDAHAPTETPKAHMQITRINMVCRGDKPRRALT
ncbi:hypothetical protein HMP09_0949 [Sphingomonas sp. HMP9]|nr:hypothetical protein HMP09_0949 [Sphingomonas sp. HMP9]